MMDRRSFLRSSLAASAMLAVGAPLRRAFASHAPPMPGPLRFGPLGPEDANGIRLPAGFTSRELARALALVPGTTHLWHELPDGGTTYATDDGGWIYVSNSERGNHQGGVGALRFDASGAVVDAYPILLASDRNCAGGSTPWHTWLSCEEVAQGMVWECDPTGESLAIPRPSLGWFSHEAAVVDPVTMITYLTEDERDGLFYRHVPADRSAPLDAGTLQAAKVLPDRTVEWVTIPTPNPIASLQDPTRHQVPAATVFRGGEGAWFDLPTRTVYFTTKYDNTVWRFDVDAGVIEEFYNGSTAPGNPLNGADNLTISPSGDLFVCEDHGASGGPLEIVMLDRHGGVVAPFLACTGIQHAGSELTGVAFDPSGDRMYFSSQRAYAIGADVSVNAGGVTFEITGPFRS